MCISSLLMDSCGNPTNHHWRKQISSAVMNNLPINWLMWSAADPYEAPKEETDNSTGWWPHFCQIAHAWRLLLQLGPVKIMFFFVFSSGTAVPFSDPRHNSTKSAKVANYIQVAEKTSLVTTEGSMNHVMPSDMKLPDNCLKSLRRQPKN